MVCTYLCTYISYCWRLYYYKLFIFPVHSVHGNVDPIRGHRGAERVGDSSAAVHQLQEEQNELLHHAARYCR